MRSESHTLISTLLGVVNQWRRREGWSRETVVQHIVEAHERIQERWSPALSSTRQHAIQPSG